MASQKQPFQASLTREQREQLLQQVLINKSPVPFVRYQAPNLALRRDELAKLNNPDDLLVIEIEPEKPGGHRGYERGYYLFTLAEYQAQLDKSKTSHWHKPPYHFVYMAAPDWLCPAFFSRVALKPVKSSAN